MVTTWDYRLERLDENTLIVLVKMTTKPLIPFWYQIMKDYCKPKSNMLIAVIEFKILWQSDISLQEFSTEARLLCDQCKYPDEAKGRLLWSSLPLEVKSKKVYYGCIEKGSDHPFVEALDIVQPEGSPVLCRLMQTIMGDNRCPQAQGTATDQREGKWRSPTKEQ